MVPHACGRYFYAKNWSSRIIQSLKLNCYILIKLINGLLPRNYWYKLYLKYLIISAQLPKAVGYAILETINSLIIGKLLTQPPHILLLELCEKVDR